MGGGNAIELAGGSRRSPELAVFAPFPLLGAPHAQTIAGSMGWPRSLPSETRHVELSGGDRIALEVSTPLGWLPADPTVVLVHGLCGSSRSGYVVRAARGAVRRGFRAVRMNLRGCGPGEGLARELYHSGRSDDALAVLNLLRAEAPASRIALVGYSLGGNLALKLAGELGADAEGLLERVIAVSPPVDLAACARRISAPGNRIYDHSFVRLLRRAVARRHAIFPELGPVRLPRALTLAGFDEAYTAPHCGFRDAQDYYARSSSGPLLARIRPRCRILVARDDPMIDPAPFREAELPPNVQVVITERGGHLGFLGSPRRPGGFRWMDSRVLDWLLQDASADRGPSVV